MWNIEKDLATKWNNIAKLYDNTKRWYQYRKYYTDKLTWFTYLSDAIKEKDIIWKKYINVKWKNLCNSMEEYNLQFL